MRFVIPARDRYRLTAPGTLVGIVAIIVLAIGQDYLYSRIHRTGFYLSESALYQSFWLVFLPMLLLQRRLLAVVRWPRWAAALSAVPTAALHLLVFAGWFTAISALVFSPGHRFVALLGSASASQLVVLLAVYLANGLIAGGGGPVSRSATLVVRSGSRTVRIPWSEIVTVEADKPYSAVTTRTERHLDDRPLRELEQILPAASFLRVHRGCIVRADAVRRLDARGNGDYDGLLTDGRLIRFSRHRRGTWEHLLRSEGNALR